MSFTVLAEKHDCTILVGKHNFTVFVENAIL